MMLDFIPAQKAITLRIKTSLHRILNKRAEKRKVTMAKLASELLESAIVQEAQACESLAEEISNK